MADAPRQKSLRKRLQRQLEFYLSESNLRQDKFLRQNMDERGFIPVRLFLSFNKCVGSCRLWSLLLLFPRRLTRALLVLACRFL